MTQASELTTPYWTWKLEDDLAFGTFNDNEHKPWQVVVIYK
jgi:hypothetical protein